MELWCPQGMEYCNGVLMRTWVLKSCTWTAGLGWAGHSDPLCLNMMEEGLGAEELLARPPAI